jgi:hypothetical protein
MFAFWGSSFFAELPLKISFLLLLLFINKVHENVFQVNIDFDKEPIGTGKDGKSVYFRDIWPTAEEIAEVDTVNFACTSCSVI